VHARALWATLRDRPAVWRATNSHGSVRSLWAVMPHVALLTLNATAIAVGVVVMADPPPTWLSVGWATMLVLILGRMVLASVAASPAVDETAAHDDAERDAAAVGVAAVPASSDR
jgi:cellulose synthase (UDP-forming)